jgi:hypothetical protein
MFPSAQKCHTLLIALMMSSCIVCLASQSYGGCARERLDYSQVDVVRLTGVSEADLVLLPKCYWSYDRGVVSVTFFAPVRTCTGPECQPELPLSHGLAAVPVSSQFFANSLACNTSANLRFEPGFSLHKTDSNDSMEIHNPFILERPPAL